MASEEVEQQASSSFSSPVDNKYDESAEMSKLFTDGTCQIVSVTTKNAEKKEILKSMMLDLPASSVTAIMGPSGCGKTTLLSVLTDNIPSTVTAIGSVNMKGHVVIVPQDDRLHGFFTVRSYMQHYARLTGIANDPETDGRIDWILRKLGLTEQADTLVGDIFFKGLSGGQMRRLSIALEALTQPEIFVLDEPTSGLDAESALNVMDFLKEYVRAAPGRHVLVTIHQPSSFIWQKIDHVILLSRGMLMYNGPRSLMEDFFEKAGAPTPPGWNPADHYVTVVNDDFKNHALSPKDCAVKFLEWKDNHYDDLAKSHHKVRTQSMKAVQNKEAAAVFRSSNPFLLAKEITYRYFLNLAFNPGILGTRLAMYSMLALMIGALFWGIGDRSDYESVQSRTAILFYCVAFFVFMSVAVLPFTVMERAIVDKEVLNKYYPPTMYQVALFISSIPGTGLLALLTTILIITMTKLNAPFWFFLNMFLALTVAEALAHLMSHVVPHFIIGMAMIAGLYGFFMLFQGFMLVPSHFPHWLKWVYYVAFHTYSWRTFMVSEFRDNEKEFTGSNFKTGEDVLEFYQIDDVNRGHDMITLAGYSLFVNLCALVVLHFRYTMFRGRLEPIPATGKADP